MGQSLNRAIVQFFIGQPNHFRSGWSAEQILLALESNDWTELSQFSDCVTRRCCTNDKWVISQMSGMDRFASITSSAGINITGFGNMAYMCIHASNPTTLPHLTNGMNIVKQMLRVEIDDGQFIHAATEYDYDHCSSCDEESSSSSDDCDHRDDKSNDDEE